MNIRQCKNFSGNEKRAISQNPSCHIQNDQLGQTVSTEEELSSSGDPESKC